MKKIFFLGIICFCFLTAAGQKVGLVFSGGGAKGLAHIGVLKALEENNIPIDYIVGTSMGGIVGGMYAAGYSPAQIEYLASSTDFQNWVNGRFESDYKYFFKKKPDNPSLITVKLQIDTGFQTKIRSNFINDIPLNFALMELLAQASANANEDFNKLFVPYRCIVADIFSQKMIPLSHGSLAEAVRGTLTVPLIYRPIKIDGKYVFDGGLYNNFPIDVMQKEFNPDYIIGTNVSEKVFNEYPKDNDEKLINRFLLYMLLSKTDSTSIGENGIYIHPDIAGFSATNFTPVEELIKRGYDATIADMPAIKLAVQRRISREEVKQKREKFNKRNPDLTFNNMLITGIKPKQKKYVESVFNNKNKSITLEDIKNGYYKLVADDNFETVYPRTSYDPKKNGYNFELRVQPQKNFKAELGGVISSRPISNAYLGLQYNYLHRNSYTFSANFYSGAFYESAQGAIRMDVPTNLPFYLETEFTYNHWNYFTNTQIFIENANPTYIDQSDRRIALKMGVPVANNGKLEVQTGYIHFNHKYSPKNSYQLNDMLDENNYNGVFASINLERNTLNRRQYATRGRNFQLGINMYDGAEHYNPGNIFRNEPFYDQIKETRDSRSWYKIKVSNEQYLTNKKSYSFGYLFESVISNQPVFSTYKATLLSASAFYPLQDSRSIFLEKMRANTYGAVGIKNIFKLYRNIDLRLEGYVFQPLEEFKLENWQSTSFEDIFAKRHYAATAGLVYNSIAGPVSLSFNHYDDKQHQFGVLFHVGFLIYNKRSFE